MQKKGEKKTYFLAQHCATLAQRAELLVLSSIKILGLYGLAPLKVINPFLKGHPDLRFLCKSVFSRDIFESFILYPTFLHCVSCLDSNYL